jgi:hypothetical protein
MKKVAVLSLVIILMAVLVVPVMAKGSSNGHGSEVGSSPGNSSAADSGNNSAAGQQNQSREQNQENEQNLGNLQNQERNANAHDNGNTFGNQQQTRTRTPFYLQGTISVLDASAKTITFTLIHGNAQVKQYLGLDLSMQATDTTLIFKITQGYENETGSGESATPIVSNSETMYGARTGANRLAIPFDQLEVGQKVAIHGNLVDNVYTITLITVYIQTPGVGSAGG